MKRDNLHFETLQLHAGQEQPDPATNARAGDHIVSADTIYSCNFAPISETQNMDFNNISI